MAETYTYRDLVVVESNMTDWDKLLQIKTTGRDSTRSDRYRYPYEPTPYPVLERLALSGYIGKKNTLLDYGCGKGRVGFFLSCQTGCRCIGVEYDERIYGAACENKERSAKGNKTEFINAKAEEYQIPEEADRFYFFNPFSLEILQKVMGRIRESWHGQEMFLFFYYPSDEYVAWLMTVDELLFMDEIDCRDLFDGKDPRECILVFQFGY